MKNWFEELMSQQSRRAERYNEPRLIAFYWDGATPKPRHIRDISRSGLYLLTDERWYPGTLVTMTLQRTEKGEDGSKRSVGVQAKVIRSGNDGVALSFVMPEAQHARNVRSIVAEGIEIADKMTLDRFLQPFLIRHPIGPGREYW
jgi:PilZ domain